MTATDERAWMRHPELPDSEPIAVVKSQVPHLAAGGWFEVEASLSAPPEDPADEHAPTGEAKSKPQPNKTPRRREEKSS